MQNLSTFFKAYGEQSAGGDPRLIAQFYAGEFIAAGPEGSKAFKNDEDFIHWLEELQQFNKQAGLLRMKLLRLEERLIGEYYKEARVTWGAVFEKTGDKAIEFDISYFLFLDKKSPKIILYISYEDQEALMKRKGLL